MTIEERRVKVIEKVLDDSLSDEVAMELGIQVKTLMLLSAPDNPMAPKIQQSIEQEKAALANHPRLISILQGILEKAQDAVLRGKS